MTYCRFREKDGAVIPKVPTVMAGQPGIML
jgi:hypothetical protein